MNQTRQKLNQIGCQILANSRNEIYLSMRFMDIALSMLSYEMNLSTTTVGIDGMKILFNPRHLIDLFRESSTLVNRAYMHMILHGIFGHVYGLGQRNEEYWNLACDIAVASILDEMPAASVRGEIPDFHREVFDNLRKDIKVLNAESICLKKPLLWMTINSGTMKIRMIMILLISKDSSKIKNNGKR